MSKILAKGMTKAQLEALSAEFDQPDFEPRSLKAPPAEQRRHDRALRRAKLNRARPPVGKGAERIQITVERSLLAEADMFAQRRKMSRSQLIAQGLRLALAS